jgi:sugar phosphate isomerase/epimerase
MRLGISSYTFGWAVGVRGSEPAHPLDEMGLLDKATELGVDLVQVGDNLPLVEMNSSRLEHFAAAANERHIQIEVGARRLTAENISAHLAVADRLGARLLRFVIDDGAFRPNLPEITAILRTAAPALQERQVVLGIENHDRFAARTLAAILEEVGSDSIGICLDTANSLGAGEGICEVLDVLIPWTVNLHIKDFTIQRLPYLMGFMVTGRPAGDGMLDIPQLLESLGQSGRCKTAILELWTPPEAEIDQTVAKEHAWAVQSLDYLKPLFQDDGRATVSTVAA